MNRGRHAFTILELVAAFTILSVLLVLVAQLGFYSLRERTRCLAQQAALETANNVLESARALPWEKLTQSWADSQRLAPELDYLLPSARLTVKVEPDPAVAQARRVTATIGWKLDERPAQTVRLVGVFTAPSRVKEARP